MQAQSFQRYFVWGALAAVFVLILIQWDKDYGTPIGETSPQTKEANTLAESIDQSASLEKEDLINPWDIIDCFEY